MVFLSALLNACIDRRSDTPMTVKEFGFPRLLFRNNLTDSCFIIRGLRASEARPNTRASWSLPSTEPLSGLYRTSSTLSLVHFRLTIHT